MKKISLILAFSLLLSLTFIVAHGEETFHQAEELIEQKVPCSELNDAQLEAIGDYYMEQIHPGEQHEYMDEMMGGEGSESLKSMHINMAYRFYCDEESYESYQNSGWMGRMMYDYGYNTNYLFLISSLIIGVGIVLLIIWLSKNKQKRR